MSRDPERSIRSAAMMLIARRERLKVQGIRFCGIIVSFCSSFVSSSVSRVRLRPPLRSYTSCKLAYVNRVSSSSSRLQRVCKQQITLRGGNVNEREPCVIFTRRREQGAAVVHSKLKSKPWCSLWMSIFYEKKRSIN